MTQLHSCCHRHLSCSCVVQCYDVSVMPWIIVVAHHSELCFMHHCCRRWYLCMFIVLSVANSADSVIVLAVFIPVEIWSSCSFSCQNPFVLLIQLSRSARPAHVIASICSSCASLVCCSFVVWLLEYVRLAHFLVRIFSPCLFNHLNLFLLSIAVVVVVVVVNLFTSFCFILHTIVCVILCHSVLDAKVACP